jgi:hypothetical protein
MIESPGSDEDVKPVEQVLDAVLTAGPLVLSAFGASAVFGDVVGLAADHLAGRRVRRLEERVGSLDDRVRQLEGFAGAGSKRLQGTPLRLLARDFETELGAVWAMLSADEAIAQLCITPQEYREAVEELAYLGLVDVHGNANHASGIARTRLTRTAVLTVGPTLLPQLDWEDYVASILVSLQRDREPERQFLIQRLQDKTRIPRPRLHLLLRALNELDVVDAKGPGTEEYGEFRSIELTVRGRRVLRGDEGIFG